MAGLGEAIGYISHAAWQLNEPHRVPSGLELSENPSVNLERAVALLVAKINVLKRFARTQEVLEIAAHNNLEVERRFPDG